jgi:hypothetical protein
VIWGGDGNDTIYGNGGSTRSVEDPAATSSPANASAVTCWATAFSGKPRRHGAVSVNLTTGTASGEGSDT